MQKQWFLIKVKRPNSENVITTQTYALNAYDYTHAEFRVKEWMKQLTESEFRIESIVLTNYMKVLFDEDIFHDDFWKVKSEVEDLDDKPYTEEILVNASDITQAIKRANTYYREVVEVHTNQVAASITNVVDVDEVEIDFSAFQEQRAKALRENSPQMDLLDEVEKIENNEQEEA